PQTIQGPPNAQPLQVLLQRYGIDVGRLGKSLRGGLGTNGALPESGGPTKAPTPSATQAYQQCLSQAAGQAALQRCANLLAQQPGVPSPLEAYRWSRSPSAPRATRPAIRPRHRVIPPVRRALRRGRASAPDSAR